MDNKIMELLDTCDDESLKEISRFCDRYFNCKRKEKQDEKYNKNQRYVGKCYELDTKNGKKFYKVISVKGDNQFRVSCLVFDEKPSVKFSPAFSKAHSFHENEGHIDFDGIYVEDIMIKNTFMNITIENMTEISEGEWRYALQRYTNRLIEFDWSQI